MQIIRIHDKDFVPFLSQAEVEGAIKKLGEQLSTEYEGKLPLFIPILNGAFMFAAELFKHVNIPCEICFIKLASYKGTTSAGHVITSIGLDTDVKDKHVIILEDILDTGKTLNLFLPQIKNQQPKSLKVAAMLHKPDAKKFDVPLNYNCFKIPDKFVVGFGLDYDGYGRNLPAIYKLKED
jgi:hypoxanthine phosphoribosyltransferase